MSSTDAAIIAYALGEHARELRKQARSRKYAGEHFAGHRAVWRERAARCELLATQAASMAEVFEEPSAVSNLPTIKFDPTLFSPR